MQHKRNSEARFNPNRLEREGRAVAINLLNSVSENTEGKAVGFTYQNPNIKIIRPTIEIIVGRAQSGLTLRI